MIKPVAARLRFLLAENPARSSCSLLMTGHSAGGAVASLLYAHMLAEHVRSELNTLTSCAYSCLCQFMVIHAENVSQIHRLQAHSLPHFWHATNFASPADKASHPPLQEISLHVIHKRRRSSSSSGQSLRSLSAQSIRLTCPRLQLHCIFTCAETMQAEGEFQEGSRPAKEHPKYKFCTCSSSSVECPGWRAVECWPLSCAKREQEFYCWGGG